jgi:hypothetical protein
MPIRPRDFDATPTTEVVADKQARAKQERDIPNRGGTGNNIPRPRRLRWAVAAAAIALAVFASQKPLHHLVTRLLTPPARAVSNPRVFHSVPAEQGTKAQDHVPESKPDALPATNQESLDSGRSKLRPFQQIPSESNSSQVLKDDLERQQAELELKNRQLADAQKAIEAQKLKDAEDAGRASEQTKRDLETAQRAKEKELSVPPRVQAPYMGPSSGSLVWEGPVDGADLIDIQDGSPNRGSLTGTLPGVPIMVQAFPANDVTIAVAPSPSNGWKRIVLRVRAKGLKKVTVRWALP